MEGSILVNGIDYNQPMPANEQLTDIEVAQILTYITNSWQNQSGYFPVSKVSTYLDNCDDL
jgi:mono/diheme cytochrome c family protein